MNNIHHPICGVIPPHILRRVGAQATLEQMRGLIAARAHTTVDRSLLPAAAAQKKPEKHRRVYDTENQTSLPGKLIRSDHKTRGGDIAVIEAWSGSGDTFDFFEQVFGRDSIDGRGMTIVSSVHYGFHFDNAMWDGRQMVYGDGDGRIFNRFTVAKDVIGHELTHGITQYTAGLSYEGQTGALNEHISDAFEIMVKQWVFGQTVHDSDWLIGAGLFTPRVKAAGIRSMAAPGTAYDDPLVGRDPQPSHMSKYVETDDDNGGVHINSGIPNHAFYLAAMALGGKSWETLGKVWFTVLKERLKSDADFEAFARATVDVAGEQFGHGGSVQRIIAEAWTEVGLPVAGFTLTSAEEPISPRTGIQPVLANLT
jgi:Zn-dependent metalloprotease